MTLAEKLLAIHRSLDDAALPHAFGGAIALGYCTEEPRGTRDIDVNIFVEVEQASRVIASLPAGVKIKDDDRIKLDRDGQARTWWDDTPVDLFLDVHDFHKEASARTRTVPFEGVEIPILDCGALTVFKAMFARPKDWVDIQTMHESNTVEVIFALGWITRLLGPDHDATQRLANILRAP